MVLSLIRNASFLSQIRFYLVRCETKVVVDDDGAGNQTVGITRDGRALVESSKCVIRSSDFKVIKAFRFYDELIQID